jgi:iron complex outermembrane recepter protein
MTASPRSLPCLLLAALLPSLGPLRAQSTADDEVVDFEPFVVSAAKTGEPLAELPIAATVLLPTRLEALRIDDITRIEQTAPNVSLASSGQIGARFFTIRGLESNSFIVNRTATYIDGIPFRELDTETFPDVASIEILRGPQGTLYGTNTEAGVVIINTRRPGPHPAGRVELGWSSFRHGEALNAVAYASTPLPFGGLSASLALGAREADAHVPNPLARGGETGEVNQRYGRFRLLYAPGSGTELQFLAYGTSLRAPGIYEQDYLPTDRERYNALYRDFNGGRALRQGEQAGEEDKFVEQDDYGFALQGETALTDDIRLAFVASVRREVEDEFGIDFDLTAMPTATGGTEKTVDSRNLELRAASAPGAERGWVVGLNHYGEDKEQTLNTLVGGASSLSRFAPGFVEGRDYAAFGQVKLPFAAARLHLTLGLRYEVADRTRRQEPFTISVPGFGDLIQPGKALDETFSALLPRLALHHTLGERGLAYASITRGWLPGGFNLEAVVAGVAQDLSRFDPEYTWAYETGVKNEWLEGRLRAAAAIFYNDVSGWQDYNVLVDLNGVAQSTNIIANATRLESHGAEFEVAFDFAPGWTADASLGLTRATYGDYLFGPAQDFSHHTVKLVPAWDASLGLGYAPARGWFFRADLSLKGPTYLNPENTFRQSTLALVDLSVGYSVEGWRFTAFVENATDAHYFNGQVYTNFALGNDGLFYGPIGAPRVVGLSARFSY